MDELAAQISELLESPDGMERIRRMAAALTSEKGGKEPPSASVADMGSLQSMAAALMGSQGNTAANNAPPEGGLSLSPGDMQTVIKIMGALRNGNIDGRSRLLLALRPYLSERRQRRVDSAVKILRLASIIPLLKESGLGLF